MTYTKIIVKKTKEVENPMIIRDDIVKWNWIGKGKSELKDITELLHIEVCFDQRQNTHRYIYLGGMSNFVGAFKPVQSKTSSFIK